MDLKLKEVVKKTTKKEIQKLFISKTIPISDILIKFNKTLPNFYLCYGTTLKKIHIFHKQTSIALCKDSIKIINNFNNPLIMFQPSKNLCKNCLKIYKGLRGD